MHNSTVEIINDSYMFRLQGNHNQALYNIIIKGNYIIYNYIISFYTSGIYSLIMATLYPKYFATMYNSYSKVEH